MAGERRRGTVENRRRAARVIVARQTRNGQSLFQVSRPVILINRSSVARKLFRLWRIFWGGATHRAAAVMKR